MVFSVTWKIKFNDSSTIWTQRLLNWTIVPSPTLSAYNDEKEKLSDVCKKRGMKKQEGNHLSVTWKTELQQLPSFESQPRLGNTNWNTSTKIHLQYIMGVSHITRKLSTQWAWFIAPLTAELTADTCLLNI